MLQLESKKLKAHRSLHKTFKNCKLTNKYMDVSLVFDV